MCGVCLNDLRRVANWCIPMWQSRQNKLSICAFLGRDVVQVVKDDVTVDRRWVLVALITLMNCLLSYGLEFDYRNVFWQIFLFMWILKWGDLTFGWLISCIKSLIHKLSLIILLVCRVIITLFHYNMMMFDFFLIADCLGEIYLIVMRVHLKSPPYHIWSILFCFISNIGMNIHKWNRNFGNQVVRLSCFKGGFLIIVLVLLSCRGGLEPRMQTLQSVVRLAGQASVPSDRAQLRGDGWNLQVSCLLHR